MAEILIEKKAKVWPWVLAGLIIAVLLVYFVVFRDTDNNTMADYTTNSNEPESIEKGNNGAVAAYIGFVENDKEKMGLDHAYTNEALLKLIEATSAKANEVGYDIKADLEKVKGYANMITNDPFETTHADNIRKADDVITNVLQNIQQAKYPDLANEVEGLKMASESIKQGVLTLDQKEAVKNYFTKAADLLQKMN